MIDNAIKSAVKQISKSQDKGGSANMNDSEKIKEIIEIIAGMEGFKAETAPEAYLLRVIEQINRVAVKGDF